MDCLIRCGHSAVCISRNGDASKAHLIWEILLERLLEAEFCQDYAPERTPQPLVLALCHCSIRTARDFWIPNLQVAQGRMQLLGWSSPEHLPRSRIPRASLPSEQQLSPRHCSRWRVIEGRMCCLSPLTVRCWTVASFAFTFDKPAS